MEYRDDAYMRDGLGLLTADLDTFQIRRKPFLSSLINEYERAA
jgi:hypothetical protein